MADSLTQRFLETFQVNFVPHPSQIQEWARNDDSFAFMTSLSSQEFLTFASLPHVFVDTFLAKPDSQDEGWKDELANWNFGSSSGWRLGYEHSEDAKTLRAWIEEPYRFIGPQMPRQIDQLVFERQRPAIPTSHSYLELNQRFVQALDLHALEDSDSYVMVNHHGDFEEIVNVAHLQGGHFCTIDVNALSLYMLATEQVLVRVFALHRCSDWHQLSNYQFAKSPPQPINHAHLQGDIALITDKNTETVVGSLLRGSQVIDSLVPNSKLAKSLADSRSTGRPSISFLALELSSGRVGHYPPVDSDDDSLVHLNSSISPAFFRSEVLSKYKQYPDKYEVTGSMITCRGLWSLRSYHVNEAGQVFAYLKDLWNLPKSEQTYWQSFNERPKSGISKTALQQDFLVEWSTDPDPARDLTQALRTLSDLRVGRLQSVIWTPQDDPHIHKCVQELLVNSLPEWREHINGLAKAIVEGFQASTLKMLLKDSLGRPLTKDEKQRGSLALLRDWLLASGIDDAVVNEVVGPLFELQNLRSTHGVAHRGKSRPIGDLRVHYRNLLGALALSVAKLVETVDALDTASQ